MTKITPLEDRILILPKEGEKITGGGIYIPDSVKEKPQRGEVKAVGEGTESIKMKVQIGNNVLFRKNAGTEIMIDEITYLIMRQSDILAII